jgi:hypothetical protein
VRWVHTRAQCPRPNEGWVSMRCCYGRSETRTVRCRHDRGGRRTQGGAGERHGVAERQCVAKAMAWSEHRARDAPRRRTRFQVNHARAAGTPSPTEVPRGRNPRDRRPVQPALWASGPSGSRRTRLWSGSVVERSAQPAGRGRHNSGIGRQRLPSRVHRDGQRGTTYGSHGEGLRVMTARGTHRAGAGQQRC